MARTEPQQPTIGRIVRYHSTAGEPGILGEVAADLPAIITNVNPYDLSVNLKVFVDQARPDVFRAGVTEGEQVGQWSWPGA